MADVGAPKEPTPQRMAAVFPFSELPAEAQELIIATVSSSAGAPTVLGRLLAVSKKLHAMASADVHWRPHCTRFQFGTPATDGAACAHFAARMGMRVAIRLELRKLAGGTMPPAVGPPLSMATMRRMEKSMGAPAIAARQLETMKHPRASCWRLAVGHVPIADCMQCRGTDHTLGWPGITLPVDAVEYFRCLSTEIDGEIVSRCAWPQRLGMTGESLVIWPEGRQRHDATGFEAIALHKNLGEWQSDPAR